MTQDKHITILGLGNILLGDEGFGVHFVKWFEERHRLPDKVEIVDGGTLGYFLLDIMDRSSSMIIIDVIKLSDTPGSIYRFTQAEFITHMPPPTSAHEVTLADVLCKAEMIGELPEIVFLCIVPLAYQDLDLELTPELKAAFLQMERLVLAELEILGVVA
ncbi:MAG: hydrogenase maturation protease [Syntrophaceae bacterium]